MKKAIIIGATSGIGKGLDSICIKLFGELKNEKNTFSCTLYRFNYSV